MENSSPLQRAFAVNSALAAFPALVDTIIEPAGDGIFTLGPVVPDSLLVQFFGAGANDSTFEALIIGWDRIGSDPFTSMWIWRVLASYAVTLSAAVGIVGSPHLANTDRWADTIALGTLGEPRIFAENATPAIEKMGTTKIFTPSNDVKGYATVPLLGSEKLQICTKIGTATNANAMLRFLRNNH